jgi:putative peptidoglycan lipid II flippase
VVVSGFATNQIASSLALSASVASWLQLVLALALLRRKLGGLLLHTIVGRLLIFAIAAALASVAGTTVVNLLGGGSSGGFVMSHPLGPIVALALGGLVMTGVYVGVLLALRNDDAKAVVSGGIRLIRMVFTR